MPARGQRLAGDPGREAEVVFDLRAGAGLAARRVGLDDENIEPLGRGVDRGSEPARPRADDEQIADVRRALRTAQAEAVGDLLVGRVLEHLLATADDDGHIAHADVKAVEQRLDVLVAIDIDVRVRMGVAREELLYAESAGGVVGADEHGVAEPVCDQRNSPQDERAHQYVAQLGVALDDLTKPVGIESEQLARLARAPSHERAVARQHAGLPGEIAGPVHGDEVFAVQPWSHNLEATPSRRTTNTPATLSLLEDDLARAKRNGGVASAEIRAI